MPGSERRAGRRRTNTAGGWRPLAVAAPEDAGDELGRLLPAVGPAAMHEDIQRKSSRRAVVGLASVGKLVAVVEQLRALLDYLGAARPVLFGRDFGAICVAAFKSKYPGRVGAPLVLQDCI